MWHFPFIIKLTYNRLIAKLDFIRGF